MFAHQINVLRVKTECKIIEVCCFCTVNASTFIQKTLVEFDMFTVLDGSNDAVRSAGREIFHLYGEKCLPKRRLINSEQPDPSRLQKELLLRTKITQSIRIAVESSNLFVLCVFSSSKYIFQHVLHLKPKGDISWISVPHPCTFQMSSCFRSLDFNLGLSPNCSYEQDAIKQANILNMQGGEDQGPGWEPDCRDQVKRSVSRH